MSIFDKIKKAEAETKTIEAEAVKVEAEAKAVKDAIKKETK